PAAHHAPLQPGHHSPMSFNYAAPLCFPPPFPTRRSSDLFLDGFAVTQAVADRSDVIHAVDIRRELLISTVFGDFLYAPMQVEKIDRKSTRLNSSHVAISYAVFCLKKKTNGSTASGRCSFK